MKESVAVDWIWGGGGGGAGEGTPGKRTSSAAAADQLASCRNLGTSAQPVGSRHF